MTEKQQELYIKTKARLRRMGVENPADVIVALAEEIDRYREKIHTMEEFIAKRKSKRGNESALVAELRNKTSRDNRDLLDRAANRIEELEANQHKQSTGKWKWGNAHGQYGIWCTECGAGWTDSENAEWIAREHDYCPKCGAYMKGGE